MVQSCIAAALEGDFPGLLGISGRLAGSGEPGHFLSIPPSPSSQEDGGDKEQLQEEEEEAAAAAKQLSHQGPEGGSLGTYSCLGPAVECGSLGDTPLSPLIKSSLSEELSENLLGLGLDPVAFVPGTENPGSRSGVALAAGSTDSCFSATGGTTDRETLSTVSSYRSEKTDSTQLESPSLSQPRPAAAATSRPTTVEPGGQDGSDTDNLSDSVLLRSPSKEFSLSQGLDKTLVEGEDLPPALCDGAPPLHNSSPSSSGHSEICDLDRTASGPPPPLPPPRQANSAPSGLALGLVCSEPALPVSSTPFLLPEQATLQAQQVVRPKDLKLLRAGGGGGAGHRPGRRKAPRRRAGAGSSSFDCGTYRRHHNHRQHRDYIPVHNRLGAKAYSESLFEDSSDEDDDDGSDMSAGSSLGSQRRYSSDDSSSSTSCYSPDLANSGVVSQTAASGAQVSTAKEAETSEGAVASSHCRAAQRSSSTASAKTHARVLSMDGAGGSGQSNAAALPPSTQLTMPTTSTPAPRTLTISKSDLEARTIHGDSFPAAHHYHHRLDSLGGSWTGNQMGWRAEELVEEGAVGGGEAQHRHHLIL